MLRYVVRRLLLIPFVLAGMLALTFTLSQIVPTDPIAAFLGARYDVGGDEEATIARIKAKWGWDKPIWERYVIYVSNIAHGDLGVSSSSRRPVAQDLVQYAPSTLELVAATMLVAYVVALSLGAAAAARRGGWLDRILRLSSVIAVSSPVFWLAIIAINVFYRDLGWVPGAGQIDLFLTPPPRVTGMMVVDSLLARDGEALLSTLAHLVLPVALLGGTLGLYLSQVVRTEMVRALDSDYVRTAHGKGLARLRVLYGHAFRNALIPVLTLSGLAIGSLLTSTIVVERAFGRPGLGTYAYLAAVHVDLPGIAGVILVVGTVYLLVNLLVDVLYAAADPRVRVR